jgi:HK97 family phage prohead protease
MSDDRTIRGYAIIWNALSLPLGGFREKIARGAYDRTEREKVDVRAFVGHDPNQPIGRISTGTLRLAADGTGLHARIDVPHTSWGDDLLVSRARGDFGGFSFGFSVHHDTWEIDGDLPVRTVTDAIIREVSPVTMPAYPQTEGTRWRHPMPLREVVHRDDTRDPAREIAALMHELASQRGPDVRIAVRYDEHGKAFYRELPPPAPGWRLRLNYARQRQAEACL